MHRALRVGGIWCLAVVLATASGCSSSSNGTTSDAGTSGDGGKGPLSFTPSNIDISGMDLSKIGDIDITANPCTLSSEILDSRCFDTNKVAFKTITQSNNGTVGVYVAQSWKFEAGSVVSVFGKNPVALVALGTIDVAGSFSAAALSDNPTGGGNGAFTTGVVGSGPGGGAAAGAAGNAGAGGSFCGIGGAGGVGGGGAAAAGGSAYGDVQLVPILGGSQGGGGPTSDGGAGGGAIQLVAGTSITIESTGVINVGGGHGNFTGGGGGSGGAILLEASNVTVAGTLAANGGGGQGGPTNASSDALASNQPAPGSAAAAQTAAGGNGSAGANVDGATGGNGDSGNSIQSGGGGGAAGFIRINSKSGAADLSGTLSPDATTKCTTQGTLK